MTLATTATKQDPALRAALALHSRARLSIQTPGFAIQDAAAYHLKTLWLFVYKEAKTAVAPWVLFGLVHALCADQIDLPAASTAQAFLRLPHAACWIFVNLLPFCIGNQRRSGAILEDSLNKPWRPIPSKRISPPATGYLMVFCYVLAFLFSAAYGGMFQFLAALTLGYVYNDLGGDGSSWYVRNLLNGLGFVIYSYGAMELALDQGPVMSFSLLKWLSTIVLVIASTSHVQDMPYQIGDKESGRCTVPLLFGDAASRLSIAVAVIFWSIACGCLWASSFFACWGPIVVGSAVVLRTSRWGSADDDKNTAKLWNLWLLTIYTTPLLNRVVSIGGWPRVL